ncbi:MAG: YeeE/YedE family protein [Polyangiales bacterium]
MEHFTPWSSLAGGLLIGLSTTLFLLGTGRIAGISGIVGGLVVPAPSGVSWRVAFVGGLLAGGAVLAFVAPTLIGTSPASIGVVAVAGALVGVGTRIGSGCTSGHGVCGVSRLAPRSLVATLTFMGFGAATVFIAKLLLGGTP